MPKKNIWFCAIFLGIWFYSGVYTVLALPSKCEECHIKISPKQVKDFN